MGEWWFNAMYFNVFGDDVAAVFREEDIRAMLDPTVRMLFQEDEVEEPAPITAGMLDPTARRLFAE